MIRLLQMFCLVLASLSLTRCANTLHSQQTSQKWSTGFWFWHGNTTGGAWSGEPLDVLFIHVGRITESNSPLQRWGVYGELPDDFPEAREYWLVYRYERQGVPGRESAQVLAREASRLMAAARKLNLKVAGIQLDIDSPTGQLDGYAAFLREFRKGIPRDAQISITALLDWFRPNTDIAAVIKEADEFVPQFYDLAPRDDYNGGSAIAAKIDAARWGPVFNKFGKRFRIGISTFGRSRMIRQDGKDGRSYFYRDLAPLDIAANPAFLLHPERNQANELLLNYRAVRKTRIAYNDFSPGDTLQFILPTPEAIRAATQSARQMGGNLAGVVYFRWSDDTESLSMQPDEVLAAAGLFAKQTRPRNRILAVDGHCAAVNCTDIYLDNANPFSREPLHYRIRSSKELEYFLPEQKMPARMTGPALIELSLPPYCARGRLYLGSAVTTSRAEFTVEELP